MRLHSRVAVRLLWLSMLFPALLALGAPREELGKIEVLRDKWGVPHVFSDTDGGAMYGLGYACAEDRAFQMYYSLRIIQGRAAEVVGDVKKRRGSAVADDKKMRIFGFYRAAKRLIGNLDEETVTLLQAYSDGVNDYMAQHRDELLFLFEKLDIEPEPWTPADCIVSWWHLGKFFAGEGLHDTMVYHQIKDGTRFPGRGGRGRGAPAGPLPERLPADDSAAVVRREDVSDEWVEEVQAFARAHRLTESKQPQPGSEGLKFSHAWVVGGKKTTTGSAVLCSDPQTPVRNPSLFYEFHICGETFNARGVGVPGSPVILIGFNETVAWGMTALGADQADQFMLKTDQNRPNQYLFDGAWRDMTAWTETIKVKDGERQTITLKDTHFGPIVTEIAHGLRPGEEVALKRIPICETDRETIQGAIGMMRARDVHEFLEALEGWRFPSASVVFGDKKGNIGYTTVSAIPIRSPFALDAGNATHDGSESEYDWQGILPARLHPHAINPKRGYFGSGNNRPIESFYAIPIGISTGSGGDTIRSWRLRERLEMKEIFTLEDVLDVHYDSVNAAKREIIRIGYHLRDVLKTDLSEDALKALKYLENWYTSGSKSEMNIKGTELVNAMPTNFRMNFTDLAWVYGGGQSGLCYFLKTVKTRIDQDSKATLSEPGIEYIDQVLALAWNAAARRYGRDTETWSKRAQQEVRQRKLGYFESLDGFPSLDPGNDLTAPALSCIDGGTILSQAAQSYSQWVPLHDVDSAKSICPIGQSEHPDSPLRTSTYESWGKGKLRPAPITRKAVEKYILNSVKLSGQAEKQNE